MTGMDRAEPPVHPDDMQGLLRIVGLPATSFVMEHQNVLWLLPQADRDRFVMWLTIAALASQGVITIAPRAAWPSEFGGTWREAVDSRLWPPVPAMADVLWADGEGK